MLEKQLYEVVSSSKLHLDSNAKNLEGTVEKLELRRNKVAEVRKRQKRIFELAKCTDLSASDEKGKLQAERDKLQQELDISKQ